MEEYGLNSIVRENSGKARWLLGRKSEGEGIRKGTVVRCQPIFNREKDLAESQIQICIHGRLESHIEIGVDARKTIADDVRSRKIPIGLVVALEYSL